MNCFTTSRLMASLVMLQVTTPEVTSHLHALEKLHISFQDPWGNLLKCWTCDMWCRWIKTSRIVHGLQQAPENHMFGSLVKDGLRRRKVPQVCVSYPWYLRLLVPGLDISLIPWLIGRGLRMQEVGNWESRDGLLINLCFQALCSEMYTYKTKSNRKLGNTPFGSISA